MLPLSTAMDHRSKEDLLEDCVTLATITHSPGEPVTLATAAHSPGEPVTLATVAHSPGEPVTLATITHRACTSGLP